MKKIKLIVATTIITIMMLTYTINVFAAVTAGLTITPKKNVVAPGEEFTVEVKAESIDAGNSNLSGGSVSLGGTSNLSGTGTSTGTTGQQTNIELKSIKLTGGLDTGTANDISTTITIGGDTAQASQQPSGQTPVPSVPTPTKPTPSVTQTPKTVVEQPTKNPKAGIEDAPIMLMAALAIVGTISFILLKKAK